MDRQNAQDAKTNRKRIRDEIVVAINACRTPEGMPEAAILAYKRAACALVGMIFDGHAPPLDAPGGTVVAGPIADLWRAHAIVHRWGAEKELRRCEIVRQRLENERDSNGVERVGVVENVDE